MWETTLRVFVRNSHRNFTFPPSLWPDRELRKYHCRQMSLCLMGNNPIFPNGISALYFVGLCVPPWLARHLSKVQRGLIFNFQGAGVGSSSDPTLVTSGKAQKVPLDTKKLKKQKKSQFCSISKTDSSKSIILTC